MLPEDLLEFEKDFKKVDDVIFIESWLPEPKLTITDTLRIPAMGDTWLKMYLAKSVDREKIIIEHVEGQKYWTINDHSLVVELLRCYFDGGILRRGRLYFQPGFYDRQGTWVEKPKEFIKWADGLLRWIRRNYSKDPETGFYIGPHAREWVSQKNGQLDPL